jgi:prepilin-type N-terminal cleavage/methylation domain-containing protein
VKSSSWDRWGQGSVAGFKQGAVVQKSRRGVTLFESLVVLAVLVVAAAVVTPTLSSLSGRTPLSAAADAVKARWADARARAVAEGRPYRFAVMENTGKFRVAPDSPEYWGDGGAAPAVASDSTQPPLVVDDVLPQDIRFCGAASGQGDGQTGSDGGGNWSCPIVFLPDGTTQQDAQIAFGGQGCAPLVLRIRAITGAYSTSP